MKLQGSIICISRRNRLFILIFETDVIRVKMKSIIVFLDECGVRHVQPDTKLPINAGGGLGYPMVLSLCVCVRACVHVCVFVHSPNRLHLSETVGMSCGEWMSRCVENGFSSFKPFIATLEWSTEPFLLATLSCSCTKSGQSHDSASARLAF